MITPTPRGHAHSRAGLAPPPCWIRAESGSDVTESGREGGSEGGGKEEFLPIPGFFPPQFFSPIFGEIFPIFGGNFWGEFWGFWGSHDHPQPLHLRPQRPLPLLQRVAPQEGPGDTPGGGVQADVWDALLPPLLRGQDESHGHAGGVGVVPDQPVPPPLPGDALGAAPGAQHRPERGQRPRGPAAHLRQPVCGAGGEEPSVPPPGPRAEPPVPAAPRRLRPQPALLRAQEPPELSPKPQKRPQNRDLRPQKPQSWDWGPKNPKNPQINPKIPNPAEPRFLLWATKSETLTPKHPKLTQNPKN